MSKKLETLGRVFHVCERWDGQMRVRSLGLRDGIIEADKENDRYLISVCESDTVLFSTNIKDAIAQVCGQMMRCTTGKINLLLADMDGFYDQLV